MESWAENHAELKEIEQFPKDSKLGAEQACVLNYHELRDIVDYSAISREKLVLEFDEWWQGASWTNLFESEPIKDTLSTKFLNNWKKKLQNLQDLEMNLPIIKISNESLEKLIIPLFKALPCLKSFKCNLKTVEDNEVEFDDEDNKKGAFPYDVLDFTRFLEGIESKQELEVFEINYQEDESPLWTPRSTIKFQPKKQYCLPENFEKMTLSCKIFKDFDFHSFFGIFLASGSRKELKLSMIYFDCPDAFNGFLRMADERISESENLKLNLEISLYVDHLDKVFCYFNEPIALNEKIVVKLNIILNPPAGTPTLKMTDEIKDDFKRVFSNLQHNFIEFKEMGSTFAFKYHIDSRQSSSV